MDAVFGGSLQQTICCSRCNHISTRFEPFLDLSLPLIQPKNLSPIKQQQEEINNDLNEQKEVKKKLSKHQLKKEKRKVNDF